MGNEGSMLPGLELDSKPLENTNDWTLHKATSTCGASPNLSVFCGRQAHEQPSVSSLEHSVKNLRVYRHPNILKYISSWTHQGQLCMATESVRPLTTVLGSQTVLEICLGLHDVLKALIFLHEKALCSHNNVCCAAIYVTVDGSWKLGGLEFLSKFVDLKPALLQKARAYRYEKAVPPEEDSGKTLDSKAIDTYAFGVLVEDVFRKIPDDAHVAGIKEFKEMCRKQLQSPEPSLRPKLSQLLIHPIFHHRFVIIHDFLSELPLKSDVEKTSFFGELVDQLREFPEVLLASQLSGLLLSRMVLLDKTAQEHLLPVILQPQHDSKSSSNRPLFGLSTFQTYIVPRLLHMFSVRDAQVRLLLLEHFEFYCSAFSKEQLRAKVLPELLVGIKDTNDTVVANTLKALSLLVPILGAATVIGGKRARLFTDGRPKPKQASSSTLNIQSHQHHKDHIKSQQQTPEISTLLSIAELPERPSPDGGEDLTKPTQLDEETDNWSDWDVNEVQGSHGLEDSMETDLQIQHKIQHKLCTTSPATSIGILDASDSSHHSLKPLVSTNVTSRIPLPDITSLDIKNFTVPPRKQTAAEEVDFFQDMEPVISKPNLLNFVGISESVELEDESNTKSAVSCFDVDLTVITTTDGEGWGDNEDWGDISDAELS